MNYPIKSMSTRALSQILVVIVLMSGLSTKIYSQTRHNNNYTQIRFDNIVGNDIKSNMSDIIKEIEYVPLETNSECLIAGIRAWSLSDDNIIVMSEKTMLKFSRSGKFIQRISRRGHGPGEYIKLYDFAVSPLGEIFVLDGGQRKILCYTQEGKYKSSISLSKTGHPWRIYYRNNTLLLIYQILPPVKAQLYQINLTSNDFYSFEIMSELLNSTLYPGGLV